MLPVKHFHHVLLIDPHHRAIGQCGCGAHAEWLPCKATFSEESALVQNAYCGFLPDLRDNCEYYLSFLYVKNSSTATDDYTHNSGVSKCRCRACQGNLSSLSGVSTVGLNKNANPVRRHGFRKQVS